MDLFRYIPVHQIYTSTSDIHVSTHSLLLEWYCYCDVVSVPRHDHVSTCGACTCRSILTGHNQGMMKVYVITYRTVLPMCFSAHYNNAICHPVILNAITWQTVPPFRFPINPPLFLEGVRGEGSPAGWRPKYLKGRSEIVDCNRGVSFHNHSEKKGWRSLRIYFKVRTYCSSAFGYTQLLLSYFRRCHGTHWSPIGHLRASTSLPRPMVPVAYSSLHECLNFHGQWPRPKWICPGVHCTGR